MTGFVQQNITPSTLLALVVDDDRDTRELYAQYLILKNWRVEEAADGREALAKALSSRPDVIITETRLPGLSGFDLCELLRQDRATRRTPILAVTGDAQRSTADRAAASGVDAVLVKPCLPETLLAEIQRVREKSAGLRAQSRELRDRATGNLARSEHVLERSHGLSRKYRQLWADGRSDTTSPPVLPPALVCPACDRSLTYERSHIGGVSERHQEQWDYLACGSCGGEYQYRARTRKLRRVR